MTSIEKLKKLGFSCVEPTATDNTYYFAKHIEKPRKTIQIWIILKKTPVVYYKENHKKVVLNTSGPLGAAITDFINELGYATYKLA